jgi:hypothetical protein
VEINLPSTGATDEGRLCRYSNAMKCVELSAKWVAYVLYSFLLRAPAGFSCRTMLKLIVSDGRVRCPGVLKILEGRLGRRSTVSSYITRLGLSC